MKKRVKWLLAGFGVFYGMNKYQAIKKSISFESQLVEDILPFLPLFPNPLNKREYDYYLERSKKGYSLPKRIEILFSFKEFNGFHDTLILSPPDSWQGKTIFYLHGGAYWNQPTFFHYRMLSIIATKLKARIIMPIYPKAPFYISRDVLNMVTNRYLSLLEEEKDQSDSIVLMGDSAGGGCALALLQILKQKGYPLPQQVMLLSPWLDVTNSNKEMKKIQPFDNMLTIENLRYLGKVYAGDLSVNSPLVSPIHGDFSDCPPITIFSGTHDILLADCQKLEGLGKKNNWAIKLYSYQNMPHDFSLLPTPEGKDSLERVMNILSK